MKDVYVYQALKTPQFWLIWIVLCLNVTAGIGVLGQASAMSQEMFPGRVTAAAAGGFVGLLSIFNMGGRFFWALTSDYIGRKNTYFVFFALGFVLYALVPYFGGAGNLPLFVLCFLLIISMYGGGFATVPAYLRDMFGTRYVGAIHGLLLTAWSAAGILGPVLVNYIRQYQVDTGVPKAQAYNITMYIMAGLLVGGFIAKFPDPGGRRSAPHGCRDGGRRRWRGVREADVGFDDNDGGGATTPLQLALAWGFVGIPLLWGIYGTLINALKLFQ
jgi:MFS family permease